MDNDLRYFYAFLESIQCLADFADNADNHFIQSVYY